MAQKRIDETAKKKIAEAHKKGTSMRKIASEFGVSLSSVHRIVKENSSQKGQAPAIGKDDKEERKKRIEKLEKRIKELEKKIQDIEAKKGSWKK